MVTVGLEKMITHNNQYACTCSKIKGPYFSTYTPFTHTSFTHTSYCTQVKISIVLHGVSVLISVNKFIYRNESLARNLRKLRKYQFYILYYRTWQISIHAECHELYCRYCFIITDARKLHTRAHTSTHCNCFSV